MLRVDISNRNKTLFTIYDNVFKINMQKSLGTYPTTPNIAKFVTLATTCHVKLILKLFINFLRIFNLQTRRLYAFLNHMTSNIDKVVQIIGLI